MSLRNTKHAETKAIAHDSLKMYTIRSHNRFNESDERWVGKIWMQVKLQTRKAIKAIIDSLGHGMYLTMLQKRVFAKKEHINYDDKAFA